MNRLRSLKRQALVMSVATLLGVPMLMTPVQAVPSDEIILKDANNNVVAGIKSLTEPDVEFSKIVFNRDGTVTITTGTAIPVTPTQTYDFGNLFSGGYSGRLIGMTEKDGSVSDRVRFFVDQTQIFIQLTSDTETALASSCTPGPLFDACIPEQTTGNAGFVDLTALIFPTINDGKYPFSYQV